LLPRNISRVQKELFKLELESQGVQGLQFIFNVVIDSFANIMDTDVNVSNTLNKEKQIISIFIYMELSKLQLFISSCS